jgi:hypothetical protein
MQDVPSGENRDAILAELESILSSRYFKSSKKYTAFLRHVVERTLAKDTKCLKERILGAELFHRPLDYDTTSDPVVRITAGEVRKRIAQYYQEAERNGIEFVLPVGTYIPEFRVPYPQMSATNTVTQEAPLAKEGLAAPGTREPEVPLDLEDSLTTLDPPSLHEDLFRARLPRVLWMISAVLLVLFGFFLGRYVKKSPPTELQKFWAPVLADHGILMISAGDFGLPASPESQSVEGRFRTTRLVPAGTLYAATSIASAVLPEDKQFFTSTSSRLNYYDLQSGPSVILGTADDIWVSTFAKDLRYHFVHRAKNVVSIEDRLHPSNSDWSVDLSAPYTDQKIDYAVVARIHNASTGQWQVLAGGLSDKSIYGAGRFLRHPELFGKLTGAHPECFGKENIEFVISTPVLNGVSGPPTMMACATW